MSNFSRYQTASLDAYKTIDEPSQDFYCTFRTSTYKLYMVHHHKCDRGCDRECTGLKHLHLPHTQNDLLDTPVKNLLLLWRSKVPLGYSQAVDMKHLKLRSSRNLHKVPSTRFQKGLSLRYRCLHFHLAVLDQNDFVGIDLKIMNICTYSIYIKSKF